MEYKNETQKNVLNSIYSSQRMIEKITDLSLLSFKKTKKGVYCPFYNGIFLGCFIGKDFVKEKELQECGWTLHKDLFIF